jgi:two-component system NtrC family sensor kinase
MKLWARLVIAFLFVVLLLGGITVYTGSTLIEGTVRREAQHRTELDLRSARVQIDRRLSAIQDFVEYTARRTFVVPALQDKASQEVRLLLERDRLRWGLDALSICDLGGKVVLRTRHPYKTGDNRTLDPVVEKALKGEAAHGIVLLYADELGAEGTELPRQAFISFVPTDRAKPRPETSESSGMMLWAAVPVRGDDGKVLGAVYGGVLLTRNWDMVDGFRDMVFGDEKYGGKDLGTVTIFLWDVRIATNVRTAQGDRAIGTRVSAEVYDRVLESGDRWHARAFVVTDWYISAYEPIRDPRGKTIGILYVGILEQKYNDLRNRILASFYTPIGIAIALSVVFSLVLARTIAKPVSELVTASRRLADGDLNYRPNSAKSLPELDRLMSAYTQMADAIRQRDLDLRREHAELATSNERLTQLNRNYMEMLGFVTHELKNPLNSVIFSAAALRDGYLGSLNDKQKDSAERVVRNARYLEEMIAHYLSLSRIEKGEMKAEKRSTDLRREVVEPILNQLKSNIDQARMHVENSVPEGLVLVADPALLRIVLDNLIGNAAKYGREGGRIEVRAACMDGEVRVSVWNEGEGVSSENLPKLFGKFVRLDQPATHARKGTGLGLFLCREIVEKHGGRIWAESNYGQWAEFNFAVPGPAAPAGPPRTPPQA